MITFALRYKVDPKAVMTPATRSSHQRVGQCAAMVEGAAKRLCGKGGGRASPPQKKAVQYFYREPLNRWVRASPEGAPPFTQTGGLKNSILYEFVSNLTAIVGPTVLYGKFLEFGTRRMAARPFMRPALSAMAAKFPQLFKGLI